MMGTGWISRAAASTANLGARYYQGSSGRFLTPDWSEAPEPVPYASLTNPQSLNLYSYVLNNPVTSLDRDGHVRTDDASNLAAWAPMDEGQTAESLFGDEFGSTDDDGGDDPGQKAKTTAQATAGAAVLTADAGDASLLGAAGAGAVEGGVAGIEVGPLAVVTAIVGGVAAVVVLESRKGGGRNAQKSNPDRVASAKENVEALKKKLKAAESVRNKTPQDATTVDRLKAAIRREIDRMRESESHSQRGKGGE